MTNLSTTNPDFDALVKQAIEIFNQLSPEEQAAHRLTQRESWVRGEMALTALERNDTLTATEARLATSKSRPLVLVESPYTHAKPWGIAMHEAYLQACLHNSIWRGETPLATHQLYTRCLNDKSPSERTLGMEMLHQLLLVTDYHVVYYDLGTSGGMLWGIDVARTAGKRVEFRSLYSHPIPSHLQTKGASC